MHAEIMSQRQSTPNSQRGTIQLPQNTETPLTALRTPAGMLLYLYVRSGDSVVADSIGQDYVTFRYGEADLAFAVCDGVGQSFMGDVAARSLGDGLIDWLWKLKRPQSAEAFSRDTAAALTALCATSGKLVAEYKLPESLPPIVKQALELQRKYGSESMFVAGRLALDEDDPWVALCWLGDSPVAAIDLDGELLDLSPHGSTSERWNATTGVKGEVHTWIGNAKHVARVAGYTDGLGMDHVPTDAKLAEMVGNWLKNPPNDDASLFDVRLAYSPETVGEMEGPDETRRKLNLPPRTMEPDYFTSSDSRPIEVIKEQRSPVAGVDPIEAKPGETSAIEGWQPLTNQAAQGTTKAISEELSPKQQVQVWQQAALLGLTSAALAMMMLERLLKEQGGDSSK
jgi:hypothetical protein